MANYKNANKGELIAIYRLEFYKNKKKWKFYKNDRQLKKDVPTKQKLNETYRVGEEPPPEVEPPEPLNDAFLETDSDDNIKEELKPEPPPPTLRRWKNTILDMKLPPEPCDWSIPDVKAEQAWEPSIEPVRSYEDEWGEDAGWDGVERWGDDMQCVEQVYASELCVSGAQRTRLPVFAGWPAHSQPSGNMLQHLVQNFAAKGQRPSVADAIRQQSGALGQNGGQFGQNCGQLGQNCSQFGQDCGQLETNCGQSVQTGGQFGQNGGQFGKNGGQLGQTVGEFKQNVGLLGQNGGTLGPSSGQFGQNIWHTGQIFGQHMRQNTEILDHSLKLNTNQNIEYIDEPDILKQNLYKNCKIGQIIEQNLRHDMDHKNLEQMQWEAERDLCELVRGAGGRDEGDGGCVGDACVAGAVAALAEAEGWLTGSLKHFYLEPALGEAPCPPLSDASLSSGDSAAFVRGAHARPHSSEVELAGDSPFECESMSSHKLAHMSSAALCAGLRAHARAARRLLRELRARAHSAHAQQPCDARPRDMTDESLPTRDTAPGAPPAPPHAPRDAPPAARGRGRRLLTK